MKQRVIFGILCTVGLFAILSSTMSKSPVLPLFAKHLGANEPEIGVIAAASTIPGILLSIPAGALSDVYGRRRIIWFSLLIFSSAPLLYLLVTVPWQLMVVRFYHGFATAIFGPVIMAMIAERYPTRRGERMGLFSSATLAGRSVAPFMGGILLTIASFQAVYLACAVSAGLALLIALLIPKDTPQYQVTQNPQAQSRVRTTQGLREVVGNFRIMVTSSMEAVQFFVYGAVEVFLILYANSIGLENLQLGIIGGIPIVVAGVTKPILGHLSDCVGRKPLIVAGLVVGAVIVATFQVFTSFFALSLVSLAFGLAFATVTSSTSAFVADVCKEDSFGAALGVLSTIMDIGQAAGPPIIGIVTWKYGYGATFTILGSVLLVAGLIFFITIKQPQRRMRKIV
ncbi:MAG: MFS transporter [Candidatus Heimdallarchaeota archaeon]